MGWLCIPEKRKNLKDVFSHFSFGKFSPLGTYTDLQTVHYHVRKRGEEVRSFHKQFLDEKTRLSCCRHEHIPPVLGM